MRWAGAIGVAALCAGAVCVPSAYATGARYLVSGEQMREREDRIAAVQEQIAADRQQIAVLEQRSAIRDRLTEHPDWSMLFPVLATLLGEGATLRSVSVEFDRSGNGSYRAQLSGTSLSQRALTDMVLRLEAEALFTNVKPRSESLASGGVSFTIEARLGSAGE